MADSGQTDEWSKFATRVRFARLSLNEGVINGCQFPAAWRGFLEQLDIHLGMDGCDWGQEQPAAFRSLRLSMCKGLDPPFSNEWIAIWRDFSRLTGATSVTMLEFMQVGDEAAWGVFVKRYEPFFKNLLRHWTTNYPFLNSDEIVGEINYRILTRIQDFERDRWGHFRAWLRAFLKYVILESLKNHKHIDLVSQLADSTSDPSKIFDAELLRHDLPDCENEVQQRVNPIHWEWYLAAKGSDMPWGDIGASSESSESAVRKAVQRVFSEVKHELFTKGHDVSQLCLARRRVRR